MKRLGFAFLLVFAGCSKQPTTFTPSLTPPDGSRADVIADAAKWSANAPGRYFATVADTHSMEPVINRNSVVLCVRNTGQPLRPGLVAVFDRRDVPRVLHTIAAVSSDGGSAYFSGYNNRTSDGWFARDAIEGFVVGQLFAP